MAKFVTIKMEWARMSLREFSCYLSEKAACNVFLSTVILIIYSIVTLILEVKKLLRCEFLKVACGCAEGSRNFHKLVWRGVPDTDQFVHVLS